MTIIEAFIDLTCLDLDDALRALVANGFAIDRISPADSPSEADVSGFGLRARVRHVEPSELLPARFSLGLADSGEFAAAVDAPPWPANWTVVTHDAIRPMVVPPMQQELVVSRLADVDLGRGRAGMLYRDLIPSRHGGRFIASHIHIPEGGPVPDYVHYHRVRFQLIFCARGWARLVYEDQGEPFVMQAGDAVLQPPEIRHRVLESSDHLEVVEIGCPAAHDTFGEHGFGLPTAIIAHDRNFGGQRFVWHRAATATYEPWDRPGFEARNTGIDVATAGLADVRVVRAIETAPDRIVPLAHHHEFRFHFVLEGSTIVEIAGHDPIELLRGDSISVPSGVAYGVAPTDGLEFLEVTVAHDQLEIERRELT